MTQKLDRKRAIREFKERKVPRGIFTVRCAATGEIWADLSPNLDAARNSLWFSLRLGNHRNQALQAAWNTHGAGAFEFEVREKLADDISEFEWRDALKERKRKWLEELHAKPLSPW